ncbi:Nudix hydrolase 16, mitochondrial [Vitis vinifera]|uniref:Nudix hydrolase 16, mitochondrial n=1 Tax=Vitis vinifera TaxID=29760 RepID=A0A438DKC0_VITVI|nr:Nudix hydrolase 16, mitochondrial [Vitis vinifera]
MSELVARTGRHQQRYEDGCRLVAGCIPFKYRNSVESDGAASQKIVEVLMINSTSGPGLLFPKGGWENDETVEEAALREALEEAGVRVPTQCDLPLRFSLAHERCYGFQHFLGCYLFKSKTLQDESCPEGLCKAAMFALLVKEELPSWPEQSTRERSWLTIPEAIERCRHPWMRKALEEGFSKWHDDHLKLTVRKRTFTFLNLFLP